MIDLQINKKSLNEKYLPIYEDDTPTQIYFGAASAGKSYSVFNFVVLWMLQGRSILCTRKISTTLRKSVFSEVCKAIHRLKVSNYFDINKTELTIICNVTNGSCLFVGLSEPERLKSITPPKSQAFDTIIHEEVSELLEYDFDLANSRMRGNSEFKKKIILLFNPMTKSSWIYKRFFESVGWNDEIDNEYKSDHLHIMRCLYTDNKFLGKEEIDRIEQLKSISPKFYRVFGLAKFGITDAAVFTNYVIKPIQESDIKGCQLRTGADFGFQHKSSFVIIFYNPNERTIYITDEIGVRNKTRTEFINMMKDKLKDLGMNHHLIQCDSAEPATIQEARNMGLNAQPAKKGPDSIKRGYDFLQSCRIVVDIKCRQTIEELETLHYEKDSNGNYKEEPVKQNDDMIAALRYSLSDIFMSTNSVFGFKSKGLY